MKNVFAKNRALYYALVDLEKAFDRIPSELGGEGVEDRW